MTLLKITLIARSYLWFALH